MEVTLRWDMPAAPNGILSGYKVVSWLDGSSSYLWVTPELQPTSLEFRTTDIPHNSIVFFQVGLTFISFLHKDEYVEHDLKFNVTALGQMIVFLTNHY